MQGTICKHPLYKEGYAFEVPLLEGDFVSTEQGTGFVHVAPGHGEDDFELRSMKYGYSSSRCSRRWRNIFSKYSIYLQEFMCLKP